MASKALCCMFESWKGVLRQEPIRLLAKGTSKILCQQFGSPSLQTGSVRNHSCHASFTTFSRFDSIEPHTRKILNFCIFILAKFYIRIAMRHALSATLFLLLCSFALGQVTTGSSPRDTQTCDVSLTALLLVALFRLALAKRAVNSIPFLSR